MKLVLVIALAGCHDDNRQYEWDDRRVLCSTPIDDLIKDPPDKIIDAELARAASHGTVAVLHGHAPGRTTSIAQLERVLTAADKQGLDYVLFRELDKSQPHRAALALALDDNDVSTWLAVRDQLAAHHARITFFITRFSQFTADERAGLAQLAADGHSIEAHSVDHLNAQDYIRDHGLQAYLDTEALPSIKILQDAGYPITSYAYPQGASTSELDAAMLEHVARVRVGGNSCRD